MVGFLLGISLTFNLVVIVGLIYLYKKIDKFGLFNSGLDDLSNIFKDVDQEYDFNDNDFEE